MTAKELREKYLEFFKERGHAVLPSSSLIPENDPTVLFTTAGMHPLVPFLLGEKHPAGKKLVSVQKCIRTGDIDEVGDNRHLTFFEMLGNWSLGDYFKKEAIEWSFDFLTDKKKGLGLDPNRLYITVFRGEADVPPDNDSIKFWKEHFKKVGITADVSARGIQETENTRIFMLGKDDNWWGLSSGGPCGPCTEMYYDVYPERGFENKSHDQLVNEGRFIEIWNDVFMEYEGVVFYDGDRNLLRYRPLSKHNVDTGMGVERTVTVLNKYCNVYETEFFVPIIKHINFLRKYTGSGAGFDMYGHESDPNYWKNVKAIRVVADHVRAATMILADEKKLRPSNVGQGYVLRRLIRRAVRYGKMLGINEIFTSKIAETVIKMYEDIYPEVRKNEEFIIEQLMGEEEKFAKSLGGGIKALKKIYGRAIGGVDPENLPEGMVIEGNVIRADGNEIFHIYETYGVYPELSQEIMTEWGVRFDDQTMKECDEAFKKHQELSRTASAGQFKGGLADSSDEVKRLHTVAHLMLAALRQVLGEHVVQRGSNITSERLRFDFSHPQKMTPEEIKKVEDIVNEQIAKKIPVEMHEMTVDEAKTEGATGVFEHKYGEKVKVYAIDGFSKEICGGPHASSTGELGTFKISKEEASSAGIRRIKAILEH